MNNKKEPYLVYLICPYLKQLPSIRSPVVFGTRTQPLCLKWDTLGDSKTMSQSITRRQAQLPRQERRLWASLCHSAGFLKTGQEFVNSSGSGTTGKRGTHGSLTSPWGAGGGLPAVHVGVRDRGSVMCLAPHLKARGEVTWVEGRILSLIRVAPRGEEF